MNTRFDGVLDEAHSAALRAVALAREVIMREASGEIRMTRKGSAGDVVSDIDYKAEGLMISAINEAFPQHRITSEEGGIVDGADIEWSWLIDPLDGTNNVALGLPLCGSCVTLCHNGKAVVAAIYVAHEDATYSAVTGRGAFRDSRPIRIRYKGRPRHATISWINGYSASDDTFAGQAQAVLQRRFKRTLTLWSPSVDWSLLVSGRTAAVLAYKNEPEDLLCGVLLCAEAGAHLTDFSGRPIRDVSSADCVVVAAPEVGPYLANVLSALPTTAREP
ncbi:MAG: inositol monophosphatase family protein [Streptosporangiaceae bacterium]